MPSVRASLTGSSLSGAHVGGVQSTMIGSDQTDARPPALLTTVTCTWYVAPLTSVPYLLEGSASGVTMRTYEERLLQSSDHQELVLLPLRGADGPAGATVAERRSHALGKFVEELGLRKTADGFDSPGTSCENTWTIYQQLRNPPRRRYPWRSRTRRRSCSVRRASSVRGWW